MKEKKTLKWDPCDLPKTFLPKKMLNDVLRQIFFFLYSKKTSNDNLPNDNLPKFS